MQVRGEQNKTDVVLFAHETRSPWTERGMTTATQDAQGDKSMPLPLPWNLCDGYRTRTGGTFLYPPFWGSQVVGRVRGFLWREV